MMEVEMVKTKAVEEIIFYILVGVVCFVFGFVMLKTPEHKDTGFYEYAPGVLADDWEPKVATYYAQRGSRWERRIPVLGLRDGTNMRLRDYEVPCLAVPVRDTLQFPLGSYIWVWGARGVVRAKVVDYNTDTTYDLVGDLFAQVCGAPREGVGIILVKKASSKFLRR